MNGTGAVDSETGSGSGDIKPLRDFALLTGVAIFSWLAFLAAVYLLGLG